VLDLNKIEGFEWDDGNRDKNWKKHKVSNSEAEQVLINDPVIIFDEGHSTTEETRYAALAETDNGRSLIVFFTVRNNLFRVISARDMNLKERKIYNEKTEENT